MSGIRRVSKPWGYEIIWAHTDRYVGKILHVNAGERLSWQYHEVKDETIYLQTGEMDFETALEGEPRTTIRMRPGDSIHVEPGRRHRMIAVADCDILEVSTPQLDDVVRLEDNYGRAGKKEP
ncbi:MAG: cupin domain-containing protein [Myxococcales bacterium]|nr:MAG: cupin domain-containing protein [Myxococcales bacterium]